MQSRQIPGLLDVIARMHRIPTLFFGMTLVAGSLSTVPARAASATTHINLRGGVHDSFDRMVFDWPRTIPYRLSRDGDRVTLSFDAPAQFNAQGLVRNKVTRASGFTQNSDQQHSSFSFIVAANTKLIESRSGTYVIVDLVGPKGRASAPATPAIAPPHLPRPEIIIAPLPASAMIAPLTLANLPRAATTEAVSPLPAIQSATPTATITPPTADAVTPLSPSPIKLPGSEDPPLAVLQLNPGTPLALAAYARGGYGYIILERQLTLDPKQLIAGQNPLLVLQPLHLAGATGFRFVLPNGADLRVNRNGNTWVIYLATEARHVPISLGFSAEPNYALGPRLLLPVVNPPDVIRFSDPVIGDTLSIVPLLRVGDAATVARQYADFSVLTSAQGMVIAHQNDHLAVRKVANGIEIAASDGLRLSPTDDTGAQMSITADDNSSNRSMIFDYSGWRGLKGESFLAARQRLLQDVADVPPNERDRVRIELARLYFARGFGTEAWALLNHIGAKLPDLFARPEFRALHGAARILAGDADGGLEDFAMEELNEVPDRVLWEALALATKRDYPAAASKFNATIALIDKLPEPLFSRFASLALESMIATEQTQKADQWLEDWRLGKRHVAFINTAAAAYIHGTILYSTGNSELAVKEWRRAASSDDRLYRTRAELVLVDYDMVKGKLTPAAAAQRLEGLRFAWRGDALEWDILHRLTLYDFQAGKFRDGFANFERADKLYPHLADGKGFRRAIADKFRDIFTTDMGAGLTALEALSLYQDYRYLITDPVEARPIIRSLTERLVAIDLLEQATQLLEDLLPAAKGVDKAHLGARLAGIYLLDKQPQKALTALTVSQSDSLDAALLNERVLLQARAKAELGDVETAKSLLANRTDPPAQLLLGDVAWRAAHWQEAAAAFSRALGAPPAAGTALTADQIALAVKTATAMALGDDRDGLGKLASAFGVAMNPTPQHEIFALLTQPEASSNIRDIAQAAMQSSDTDLFRKFLDRYRGAPAPEEPKAKP